MMVKYYLREPKGGLNNLIRRCDGKSKILAMHSEGRWVLVDRPFHKDETDAEVQQRALAKAAMELLDAVTVGDEREITEEEASMILFQARETV